MPLLTPVVRSRSGCWMATLDPHLLVLAWIHPSVRPVLAAVYRWRRRSHGSVGLGILLAVPLVLANLVHPSLVGLVVDGRNSWVAPIRLVALSTLSSLELAVTESTLRRCSASTPSHALALPWVAPIHIQLQGLARIGRICDPPRWIRLQKTCE